IAVPSLRNTSFAVRTTTALRTSPFFTRPRGIASLTETTITSPTEAYFRFEPPRTLMHCTRRAPELSATSRFVCIWIIGLLPTCGDTGPAVSTKLWRQASADAVTTLQRLVFEIGAHSSMRTRSPTLKRFSGSWARYFFDLRIVFFSTGCVKRRSTETVTVCSFLSLVTVPVRIRLGISGLPGRRGGPVCRSRGGGLLVEDGLHPRHVVAHGALPSRLLELTRGLLEAQVEGLLLQPHELVAQLV